MKKTPPGRFGDPSARTRPFPLPVIMKILSDLSLSSPDDTLTELIVRYTGCSPELFRLPPAETAEYLRKHERVAAALLLLSELVYGEKTENDSYNTDFSDIRNVRRFFIRHFLFRPAEQVTAAPLDENGRLIGGIYVSDSGTSSSSYTPFRWLMRSCVAEGVKYVILAHNHPCGRTVPSAEDITSTEKLVQLFGDLGIVLADHLIIAGTEAFSMRQSSKFRDLFDGEEFYRAITEE